uniref:Uncharacterized protein n=1 Tax=Arundo donax TaxID=35708 RepID=A0A0A8Y8U2_ARUDO
MPRVTRNKTMHNKLESMSA